MSKGNENMSYYKTAQIAGLMYLLGILPTFLLLFIQGNVGATVNNIMANQLLFRIGPAWELIMYMSVVVLAWALFVLLKSINKDLAFLGLLWRLGEVFMGAVLVLCDLIILLLINDKRYSTAFTPEQLQALAGILREIKWIPILPVFMSLGSIVFYWLFYISKYIPGILSIWGIVSYMLMILYSFAYILFPKFAAMIKIPSGALLVLFEVAMGLWLLCKGVKIPPIDNHVQASL